MALPLSLARNLALEHVSDAVLVVDADGRIVDQNRAGTDLLRAAEDVNAGPLGHVDRYPALAPVTLGPIPTPGEGPDVAIGDRTFSSSIVAVTDGSGRPLGRAVVLRNVTLQVQAEHMLWTLATTDEVTRISNRRHFLDLAQHVLAQAQRSGRPLAWLVFDVDDLKSVNEHYGHDVGDLVLRSVAAITSASMREGDVLGRTGGDEFTACLADTGSEGAVTVAERLRAAVAALRVAVPDGYVQVTVTIGVCLAVGPDADIETSLARAGEAQIRAKESGGNQVAYYEAAKGT